MSHLLYGYKVIYGNVVHKLFDRASFPRDWFDAPDKALRAAGVEEAPKPEPEAHPEPNRAPPPKPSPTTPRGRRGQSKFSFAFSRRCVKKTKPAP